MTRLIFLLIISLQVLSAQVEWKHIEKFAIWRVDGGNAVLDFKDSLGVPDSVKIVIVDTTSHHWFVYLTEKNNPYSRHVEYVPDGLYYMIAFLYFPDSVYIQSDISLQNFIGIKLEQPAHNEWAVSLSPTLRWRSQGMGVLEYNIQVAEDSSFSNLIVNDKVQDTTYYVSNQSLMEGLVRTWTYEMLFDGQTILIESQPTEEPMFRLHNLTLMAWVYPTAMGGDNVSPMIGKDYAGGWQSYALGLMSNNKIRFRTRIGGSGDTYGNLALPLNEWTLVIGTYNGSIKKIYLNGDLDAEMNITGLIQYDNEPIIFGGDPTGPEGRYYTGLIHGAGIWNRALSDIEIKRLYESGYGAEYPYQINILSEDTRYYWRVRSRGKGGWSQWSGKQ
jgi:hypothetical protein